MNSKFRFVVSGGLIVASAAYAQGNIAVPLEQAPKGITVKEVVLPATMVRPTKVLKSELDYSKEPSPAAEIAPAASSVAAKTPRIAEPPASSTAVVPPAARVVSQTPGAAAVVEPPPIAGQDSIVQRAVSTTQNVISVRPGFTEMIPIPSNYLTRIATPFAKPEVRTVNEVEVDVVGSTMFISPNTDTPIGVFVFDGEDPSTAVTLQLIPQDIPQRDITLKVAGSKPKALSGGGMEPAGAGESHTAAIVQTFAELAKGRIPKGYTLTKPRADEYRCEVPNLAIRLGQVAEGTKYRIGIFLVNNVGFKPIQVDEKWCFDNGVAAISTWPVAQLNPGEQTEMFVMYQVEEEHEQTSERPSLLQSGRVGQ